MKTNFLKPLKRFAKWYFTRSVQTYMWIPTGMIPTYIRNL